jgi:hypothetical protein
VPPTGLWEQGGVMKTIVNLLDSVYVESKELAGSRGTTVEEFTVKAVTKQVRGTSELNAAAIDSNHEVEPPAIRSRNPGTLRLR